MNINMTKIKELNSYFTELNDENQKQVLAKAYELWFTQKAEESIAKTSSNENHAEKKVHPEDVKKHVIEQIKDRTNIIKRMTELQPEEQGVLILGAIQLSGEPPLKEELEIIL